MVSLPDIFQGGGRHISSNGSSSGNSESNISNLFCNNCTHDLALPVRKVDPYILREYEEKYAQIRNMQRVLLEEETPCEEDYESSRPHDVNERTFKISNISKETLQIYAFGFPFIRQSQLLHQPDEFNWQHLQDKMMKRQSRCQLLHRAPKRLEENTLLSRYVRNKVRKLPSLTTQKWGNGQYYGHYEPESFPPQTLLSADPEVVVFENFEIGGYYQKRCKITNVSCRKCRFQILPFGNDSQFRVMCNEAINSLAAGLSFWVTIEFFCRYLADVDDNLIVKSKHGEDLVVAIKAESVPPCLIEVNNNTCNVDELMDSLVDCGTHFAGEESQTCLTLKNIGSSARFCFIAESDWVDLEFSIDPSNTLEAEPFTIQPMYFSLKKDQEITICVTAVPPSSGLHTTSLTLLCDNGSLNRVDLVCDGLLFEPSVIDQFNMLKTFDVDIQDIVFAECYIDFGQMLTFDSKYDCFLLCNTAHVSMSFHWGLQDITTPGTEPIPVDALSIAPMSGRLTPRMAEMFCLRVDTDSLKPGVYRTLLVLVVDDLPKKCIPLNLCEKLLPVDEDDGNELRSIEAKYIEVWVECVSPSISLVPYVIDFSDFPLVQGSTVEKREIIVRNESPGALPLTWKCFEDCSSVRVDIEPSNMRCDKYSECACTLSVTAVQEGSFELSVWCVSEKGDVKVELLVKGVCCKPRLTTLTDTIDFGLVKVGSLQTTALVAKNCSSSDSFRWTLDELHFGTSNEGLVTITETLSSLSTNGGDICHRNSEVLVNYQLDCQEDALWCSVINWDGSFIPVTTDIQAPDISLSNYTLSADPIYLGVLSRLRVTVNNHSRISAAVFWGCPTDQSQAASVTVEVVPRCIVLEPEEQMVTEITLTPHEVGPLENLYIPCFVENSRQPILLKLEGNVEGLRVRVEWDSKEQHCCVVWPPREHDPSEESSKSLESAFCNCPPNSLEASEISPNASCDIFSVDSEFSLILHSVHEQSLISGVPDDLTGEVHDPDIASDEEDNMSVATSVPYLDWPIVGGRYTRDPMEEEWESHFNNLFILEEISREINNGKYSDSSFDQKSKSMCFHDIPLRKAVTQTIYIRNDTAITSLYEASVVYNFERVQEPDMFPDPEKVLKKIKTGDCDNEYVERASRHRGLTVYVTPGSGQLPPHDYVTLSVTVVARSWGRYSDMIVLQVGDLDHLCVGLNVTVTQPPIIAPQLVRFGSIAPNSPPVARHFQLENRSTTPVYICWDIFTPSPDNLPFSVMLFDRYPFDLQLTDYYGSCSSPRFRIKEKYTLMESNSSRSIEVNFYPKLLDVNVDNNEFVKKLKAVLIGHIYLTDEARLATSDENCVRFDGAELVPLRVDLEVIVEVPFLSLLNVFNYQLSFKCTAYDVMSTEDKVWNSENVIRVQNNCGTVLKASVYTIGYFYVKKIQYLCAEGKKRDSKDVITLQPCETAEVTLVCEVTEDDILDCFEPNTDLLDDDTMELGSLEMGLLCFEQEEVRQNVRLELWLFPPLLFFSDSSLNFGSVYIEDTKLLIITITAPSSEESFEAFIKSGTNGPFSINVTSGILKPKIAFLLRVSFSPKDCAYYQDTLVVRSCLEKMVREIPLTGIGTFDYRAHTY